MQDYDAAVYVKDMDKALNYKRDLKWIHRFGKLVMLQQNELENGAFIFLIQYEDGLKIDLSFHNQKNIQKNIEKDSLSIQLYGKEGISGSLPDANESSYYTKKPSKKLWDETLNQFWWGQAYAAKVLWRREMSLAKEIYDLHFMRPLRELVFLHIGKQKKWNHSMDFKSCNGK